MNNNHKEKDVFNENEYGAEQIIVLEGLEGARKNPGMYIGNTDDGSGLHKMLYEILDNAKDEIPSGCNEIEVIIRADNSIYVSDNGRGIPVEMHKKANKPTVEVVMTSLHAGGKFKGDKAGGAYEKTGGLHGVGASVVNALSDFMNVYVWRDGKEYMIGFAKGETKIPLHISNENPARKKGTGVAFLPSKEIFDENISWDKAQIIESIKESAFLNPDVKFLFKDEREGENSEPIIFNYKEGIVDYINEHLKEINEKLVAGNSKIDEEKLVSALHPIIHFKGLKNEVIVDCAFIWCGTSLDAEDILCFTNGIKQINGGAHLIGLRAATSKAVLHYIEQYGGKKEKTVITSEDVREGLMGIICVKIHNPKFSSQTKEVLINKEVKSAVEDFVEEKLSFWLDSNPNLAKLIMARVLLAAQAREAAKRARDTKRNEKNIFENNILPGKLASCQTRDPEIAELFIVEGNSAGGSAKQGRNRENQAILALRGKILNVEKVKYEKMITSAEICALITALGTGIGRSFDADKIKYHKVVIMTDADVDGYHIRTLLLTFFFRHMREIIERGYLYIAQPPLYKIKIGQKESYIKNDFILREYLIGHFLNNHSMFVAKNSIILADDNALLPSFIDGWGRVCNDLLYKMLEVFEKINQIVVCACPEEPVFAELIFLSIIKNKILDFNLEENLEAISADLTAYFGFSHKISLLSDRKSFNEKHFYLNVFYIVQNVNHNVKINIEHFLSGKIDQKFSNLASAFDESLEKALREAEQIDLGLEGDEFEYQVIEDTHLSEEEMDEDVINEPTLNEFSENVFDDKENKFLTPVCDLDECQKIHETSEILDLLKNGFSYLKLFSCNFSDFGCNFDDNNKVFLKIELKNGKIFKYKTIYEFTTGFFELIRDGLTIQRFKGLGEMNPDQLWKTAMDPKNRQFLQINIDDAEKTDQIFSILMGDNVEMRRAFIEASEYLMDEIDT